MSAFDIRTFEIGGRVKRLLSPLVTHGADESVASRGGDVSAAPGTNSRRSSHSRPGMNQLQHSFAPVSSLYRRAIGSRGGSLLPAPAATSINHVQRDSRSSRGARTPWGWRCYGYLPVRVTDARVQDVVLQTGRGLTSSGTFSGTRSGCSRPVANINSMTAQDPINHVAKPLKAHSSAPGLYGPIRTDRSFPIVRTSVGEIQNV